MIRTICPKPTGGGPNPTLETYNAPSGPNVMAVGNDNPVAISSNPSSVTRKTTPVFAVGNAFPPVVSSYWVISVDEAGLEGYVVSVP
jgi:hypothetical protein